MMAASPHLDHQVMIYYYFWRQGTALLAVLECAYTGIREARTGRTSLVSTPAEAILHRLS